jgi:flagellar biogenesis protein FliO
LPDASFSVIRVFGALVLVLALFLAGVWLFRNWQRLALRRGQPSQLQILEVKALGGKHALYVVGYQQQRLLLASSPAGVALVSHLPAADVTEVEPAHLSRENFVQVLQQAVQSKA